MSLSSATIVVLLCAAAPNAAAATARIAVCGAARQAEDQENRQERGGRLEEHQGRTGSDKAQGSERLHGDQAGRQRAMFHDGHLLLVLHARLR